MVEISENNWAVDISTKGSWKDWHYLVILFLLVLPLRGWLIFNTEVAARDSIGFIRYALQFENKPWQEVLLDNHQHPGYPLAIWAVSQPVRAVFGTDPLTMRFSAQLVSALAALALLIPMFYLGKELFDPQVGFWSALLFQVFPLSGHHLSDGISEALFLFFVAMTLWRGVVAVRKYQPVQFAWCGAWGGLAYFTRPEGALVVMAVAIVLVGMQFVTRWRKSWVPFFACGLSLCGAAAAVGSVYFLTTGQFTNKPAADKIGHLQFVSANEKPSPSVEIQGPLVASVFGVFIKPTTYFPLRLGRGLGAMAAELSQGFHYFGWIPALLGLWWCWPRLRGLPSFWVLASYCLLHGGVLLLLAMVEFYVSDRHTLVIILCGTLFAVVGVREFTLCLWGWNERLQTHNAFSSWLAPGRFMGVFLLAMVLFCLPKTVQRLHGNRVGNHQAGLWLATQLKPGDLVIDDHAYSHYYAGQVFEEGKKPVLPKGYQPTCYVVVTRSKDFESEGIRKDKEVEIRQHAKLVYQWPENRSWEEARVIIYAQPRDMQQNPWTVAP